MSAVTMPQRSLLAGHDRESLIDMAEAIADFMACCPSSDVSETSTQLTAMAISLLLDLAKRVDGASNTLAEVQA